MAIGTCWSSWPSKLLQARRTPLSLIQQALAGATTAAIEDAVLDGLGRAVIGAGADMTEVDIMQHARALTAGVRGWPRKYGMVWW